MEQLWNNDKKDGLVEEKFKRWYDKFIGNDKTLYMGDWRVVNGVVMDNIEIDKDGALVKWPMRTVMMMDGEFPVQKHDKFCCVIPYMDYNYVLRIPANVKLIPSRIFSDVVGPRIVRFEGDLRAVGEEAFNDSSMTIQKIEFCGTCKRLQIDAFKGVRAILEDLPKGLKWIGDGALDECRVNKGAISIGKDLMKQCIGDGRQMLGGLHGVKEIYVEGLGREWFEGHVDDLLRNKKWGNGSENAKFFKVLKVGDDGMIIP